MSVTGASAITTTKAAAKAQGQSLFGMDILGMVSPPLEKAPQRCEVTLGRINPDQSKSAKEVGFIGRRNDLPAPPKQAFVQAQGIRHDAAQAAGSDELVTKISIPGPERQLSAPCFLGHNEKIQGDGARPP